jgi:hypothetical protein
MSNQVKLHDTTIAQVAKCVQIAILTGTDVVDHLRQLELQVTDGVIFVTDNYKETFDENIQKMLAEATESANQENSETHEQLSLF